MMPGANSEKRRKVARDKNDEVYLARRRKKAFQDVKVSNCCKCGCVVCASGFCAGLYGLARLFGRIDGMPACEPCYKQHQVETRHDAREVANHATTRTD